VSNADTALFDAKKERHVFRFFTREMQEEALAKIGLMTRLLHALEGGRLALHYQPQLDAVGRVVGVEALLRWTDEANHAVEPDSFIPLAEETGVILPVGKWVLGSACLLARELRANGFDKVPVYVNVTAREFLSTDILSVVEEAFRATGIPPTALGLEVSEQALAAERKVADRLKVLAGWGMPLVIDHFGTGTSSLVRLESLPARAVKIDRRLVSAIERGRSDVEIIKAVAAFSFASGRQVAAVGAEREQQARLLRSVGCEVLQGFYFCRPLGAAELLAYLKKQGAAR
jgi:EAL domain-containing protein (putative c-di-GMP-specific phosphodiesterase class I)